MKTKFFLQLRIFVLQRSSGFVSSHYLQVLLAVKHNALGFDFPVFDVYFVATKDNGNVLTDAHQVTMPVRHILVGDSRGYVKHDDGTLGC